MPEGSRAISPTAVPELLYTGTWLPSGVFLEKTPPFAEAHRARELRNRSGCRTFAKVLLCSQLLRRNLACCAVLIRIVDLGPKRARLVLLAF